MIPIGRCKCMACNAEFNADEAIYHIKFDFSQDSREAEKETNDDTIFSDTDEISALADTLDDYDDGDLPKECELSLKQLADAGGTMIFKGVAVRLLHDNEKVDGKASTGKITANGCVFYEKIYFGYRYGNHREMAVEGLRKNRTCPACGSSRGLGESMGFRDNYLIMMFGNSNSGKTTWLRTIYNLGSIHAHIMNYKMTNKANNEDEWTRKAIEEKITNVQERQEDLCAYYSFSKGDKEVGFIIRDVAGELLSHEKFDLHQAESAREFARYADGVLVFRDVLSLPRIIAKYNKVPGDRVSPSIEEYQAAIQDVLSELKVDISSDTFSNRDIGESWENLHIPDEKDLAVMYVLNKSDLLLDLMNRPLDISDIDDSIIPFDYRCNQSIKNRPVLTTNSSMFSDVTHYAEFDIKNYLKCALETNHFISFEDYAFCGILSRVVLAKKYNRGITSISLNPNSPRRVVEPLAWMIECLINGRDFKESIADQYSKQG